MLDHLGKLCCDLFDRLKIHRKDPRGCLFLHQGGNAVMLEEQPPFAVVAVEDFFKTRSNNGV